MFLQEVEELGLTESVLSDFEADCLLKEVLGMCHRVLSNF